MAIQLQYGPASDLMNLARLAGEEAGAERREAGDLAFTSMILQTQARNADIAARLQAQDRAFAMQTAAANRMARTPTSATAARGPVADSVLARMKWAQGVEAGGQQEQLSQLETMRDFMDEETYERTKLNLMAGRTVAPAPRPEAQIKPRVSPTQELQLVKERFQRERRPHITSRRFIKEWLVAPTGVTPEQRAAYQTQLGVIDATIADIDRRQAQEIDKLRQGGSQVVDPITGEAAPSVDPYEGVVQPTETPADTVTGQASIAAMQQAIAKARLYFLERGVQDPSKEDLMTVTRAILAQQ